ncbi:MULTISPECIES: nitroreductase family protein [unclassified Rathayibacter]|uniref:nitroreductase family protein n=1 Tax=unclassified Rathayibacter TaxID=2609250 RepID=UPI000CE86FE5|nr:MULTISPECIES: nitroreductase family protein [unclassified Rathayibacter]PPF24496.1 nitroreductase [Rathayibacter sp. AY1F2]PPF49656.1 nitroreductase [Rathayibacter sp. AY1A1]PPG37063.1 nitroreductase [Rathayibacter sp. AY2B5]PPG99723.1 nitroreductase [Rathayibacter sp. AY1G9]PPH42747.1 nitroreductase [Rathayibacter sp. AY1F7]
MSATASRTASTSAPILDVLAERWSPRSYDASATVSDETLASLLEAARWSPSASNSQPWRFIVARRGTDEFDRIVATLAGFNGAWAGSAAVLVVALAETVDSEGKPRPWAVYDLGQSIAHLSVQAHHEGLHVHQMAGFDKDAVRAAFGVDERFDPVTIAAVGVAADADALANETLRERETAPRTRLPLEELVLVQA